MKYNYLFLLILLLPVTANSQGKMESIESHQSDDFQQSKLISDFDVFDIRIDIIRQTEDEVNENSATDSEDVPYHPLGFNLGNGLFLDINNNLSLLVPELFGLNGIDDFEIAQENYSILGNSKTFFTKAGTDFITKHRGFFNHKSKQEIEITESTANVNRRIGLDYNINVSNAATVYQSGWNTREVQKTNSGYELEYLLRNREYKIQQNEIYLGKQYIVRNLGDKIEIYAKGFLNKEYLVCSLSKSKNYIQIHNQFSRDLKIEMNHEEITVFCNNRIRHKYILTKK